MLQIKHTGLFLLLSMIIPAVQASISCPAEIPKVVNEKTVPGWIINSWPPTFPEPNKATKYPFVSADILLGVPGDEKSKSPAFLAPDEEVKQEQKNLQLWHLKSPEKTLLICHYRNSDFYLLAKLPHNFTLCTQSFKLINPKGKGSPGLVAESMVCQ